MVKFRFTQINKNISSLSQFEGFMSNAVVGNDHSLKRKITGLTEDEFRTWAEEVGEKPFRAKQMYNWLYKNQVFKLDEMGNLSKKFREKLDKAFIFEHSPIVQKTSSDDGTIKFLQKLDDGSEIESVLMNMGEHYTICVSTQVGCAMGCTFCMTGTMGLKRHLEVGEIVEQVVNGFSLLPEGNRIRNIVYMGMGEPFHNYENTIKSLQVLLSPNGFDFSSRRVTVSTSGIIPKIIEFGKETRAKANLAVSLNGIDQESRKAIMPLSKKYPIEELIQACRDFPLDARKRITFEYILFDNLNDNIESAKKLVKLLHQTKSKVNLIPYNDNPDLGFHSPSLKNVKAFQQYLLDHGVLATLRISKGQDIAAACGQLVAENQKKKKA
ncbi:MAG: 23S rRNA (adenine2503-C2)-methyltransferase [bacterium]